MKKISGNEKAGLKEAVKTLLEHEMKNLESLSADEEMWPHIDCRIQVNLDERLKKAQFELKGIENKMLDGDQGPASQTCGSDGGNEEPLQPHGAGSIVN